MRTTDNILAVARNGRAFCIHHPKAVDLLGSKGWPNDLILTVIVLFSQGTFKITGSIFNIVNGFLVSSFRFLSPTGEGFRLGLRFGGGFIAFPDILAFANRSGGFYNCPVQLT